MAYVNVPPQNYPNVCIFKRTHRESVRAWEREKERRDGKENYTTKYVAEEAIEAEKKNNNIGKIHSTK